MRHRDVERADGIRERHLAGSDRRIEGQLEAGAPELLKPAGAVTLVLPVIEPALHRVHAVVDELAEPPVTKDRHEQAGDSVVMVDRSLPLPVANDLLTAQVEGVAECRVSGRGEEPLAPRLPPEEVIKPGLGLVEVGKRRPIGLPRRVLDRDLIAPSGQARDRPVLMLVGLPLHRRALRLSSTIVPGPCHVPSRR
jgi:hypothetical protein